MKLLTRFILIAAVGLLFIFAGLYLSQRKSEQVVLAAAEEHQQDNQKKVAQAVKLISELQTLFVRDYSFWDDMAVAVQAKDLEWIASEFYGPLEIYQADAVWVFTVDGELLFSDAPKKPELINLPFSYDDLQKNVSHSDVETFFHRSENGQAIAYHVGPILYHSRENSNQEPFGYIVVAVEWNSELTDRLSQLLQAEVSVGGPKATEGEISAAFYSITQPLYDFEGSEAASITVLFFDRSLALLAALVNSQLMQVILFLTLGTLLALVLFNTFFITPTQKLIKKLGSSKYTALNAENKRGSEIAILSSLIDDYSRQMRTTSKLSQVVDVSTDAVVITNAKGLIEYVNPTWQALNGYTAAEVLGKNPSLLQSSLTKKFVYEQLWQHLLDHSPFTTEQIVNKRKDGSLYAARISVFPVLEKNTIVNFVGICQDISKRKAREHLKSEFVSLASHQLRTPITSIRWFIELLKKQAYKTLEKSEQEAVNVIEQSTLRMVALVDRLLNLSRIETGRLIVRSERISIRQFMTEITKELSPVLQRRKIAFQSSIEVTNTYIWSDPDLLHEIYANIITNAAKYTKGGGTITCSIKQEKNTIQWSISDTGIGIAPNDLPRIFERFFRANNAVIADPQGTGLGLYLVKMLVESLGGSIQLDSTIGVGTTVTFTLPTRAAEIEGEIGIIRTNLT